LPTNDTLGNENNSDMLYTPSGHFVLHSANLCWLV